MSLKKFRFDQIDQPNPTGSRACWSNWLGCRVSLAGVKDCPIADGALPARTVYTTSDADTFFTIPARARAAGGKTLKGFLTYSEEGFQFHPQQQEP